MTLKPPIKNSISIIKPKSSRKHPQPDKSMIAKNVKANIMNKVSNSSKHPKTGKNGAT